MPITIPKDDPIKKCYVEQVKFVIESEVANYKKIDDYLRLPYSLVLTPDEEGGFVASFPDLPGCLTCGETADAALKNAADAKRAWLEAAIEDGIEIPEPSSAESYSGHLKFGCQKVYTRHWQNILSTKGLA